MVHVYVCEYLYIHTYARILLIESLVSFCCIVDPPTAGIWTAPVHLYMNFFSVQTYVVQGSTLWLGIRRCGGPTVLKTCCLDGAGDQHPNLCLDQRSTAFPSKVFSYVYIFTWLLSKWMYDVKVKYYMICIFLAMHSP